MKSSLIMAQRTKDIPAFGKVEKAEPEMTPVILTKMPKLLHCLTWEKTF